MRKNMDIDEAASAAPARPAAVRRVAFCRVSPIVVGPIQITQVLGVAVSMPADPERVKVG